MPPPEPQLLTYVPALLIVCAAGVAYLYFSVNVKVKKIVLPITFAVIVGMFLAMFFSSRKLIPLPMALLVLIPLGIQYWIIRFCPRCGATFRGGVFKRAHFCSNCGNKLTADDS